MAAMTTPATWAENTEPTPAELTAWVRAATDIEVMDMFRRFEGIRATATECFRANHDGLANRLRAAERANAEMYRTGYDAGCIDAINARGIR